MKLFSSPSIRARISFFLTCLASASTVFAAGGVQPDGTTLTSTDSAQNGVPVVNIAPPNAQGVSRNSYTDFNVNPKGLILNNADAAGVSQLGGALPPNPHFHVGDGASVILNEVRSTRPSSLNGFSEIFGHRAEFILANPNGITCDGCGFINTSRATLITGSENNPSGAIGRFTLGAGHIAIQGAGFYGDQVPYVDLISRAVQVQARLQASTHLAVRTGNDQYDHATDTVSSTPATSNAPAYAIDASQLGSMYAGQIELITTQAGVGVRTAAPVIAQDSVYLQSAAGIDTAQVQAGHTLTMRAQGVLRQQGAYQAAQRIDLEAGTLTLAHTLTADQDLRLVQTRGDWAVPTLQGGTGRTELSASTGILQLDAPVFAAGDLALSGTGISNTTQLAARGNVALNTTGNIDNAQGALVFAGQDLRLRADGSVDNRGELHAQGGLSAAGLNGARMAAFTNRGGRVESGGDMSLAADQLRNTHNFASSAPPSAFGQTSQPAVRQSTGYDGRTGQTNWIETTNPGLQRGLIQSDGNIAITATHFTNDLSDVFAAGNIAITVGQLDNQAYVLRQAYTAAGSRWGKTGRHCHGGSWRGHCYGSWRDNYGWITYYYQTTGNTSNVIPASIQAGGTLAVHATQQINNATLAANAPVVVSTHATADPLSGLTLPGEGGLFTPNPAPSVARPYLIETDPRLVDVSALLGSTYFLKRIGYQPGKDLSLFLGDAAYDQRFIADQVRTQAGRRFLFAGAQTDNAQYRRLADQAAAERARLGLTLGQALTRKQIAGLTDDILWYVDTEVAGQKVLAPRLYLSPQTHARIAQVRAARLSGSQVALDARSLLNQGTISATHNLAIETRGELLNQGGQIQAGTDLALLAGGALRSHSVAYEAHAGADIRSGITQTAGISAGRDLTLAAGGDLSLTASTLAAGRDAQLSAGGQLGLNALALTQRNNTRHDGWNITDTRLSHATTQLTVGGNLSLNAGRDLRIEGAQVEAGGDARLQAGGDVQLLAVQDRHERIAKKTEYSGFLGSTKKTTTITTATTQQRGAAVQAGGALTVNSGGDTLLVASRTRSAGDTRFDTRGGNILLLAGKQTDYYRYQHTSDGLVYTRQADRGHYTEQLAASTVHSGGKLHFGTGSAQGEARGDIVVAGATVDSAGRMDFGAAANDPGARLETGHTLSTADAARVGNLRIASVGVENHRWDYSSKKLNGVFATVAGATVLLDPIGGSVLAGLGLDLQKVDRVDDQTLHQQGARVAAGGDLSAYTRGDISVSGARVQAGGQTTLDAGGKVRILAAVDRHTHQETHSVARINRASINWNGSRLSAGVDGEYHKTEQSQTQLTQQGAQISAGSNLTLRSAGAVTVAASQLHAGQDLSVSADKGLSILSAEDVQKSAEKETTARLRLSVGVGNAYNDVARAISAYKQAKAQRQSAQQALADFDTALQKMQAEVKTGQATADDLRLRREDRKYYVANLALAKVNEANAAVQIGQAGERAAAAAASSYGTGFYADTMLELHGSQRNSTSQQTTSVAASLIAGRDLGLSAGTDLHIQGSDLGAGRNLTLSAARDATIEAARNTQRRRATRHAVSYQYSWGTYGAGAGTGAGFDVAQFARSISQSAGSWNAGASAGFDRSDSTTWRNARLSANGRMAIHTGRDTAIAGASLAAADLSLDTGRNLEITSRQNTRYARGQDAGLSVGTGQIGVNAAHRREDRRWTDTPTTLIGRQRVAINTGETTTLTGALIAQIDAHGHDGGQLSLRTRRLTVRNLTDTGHTSQWNAGLSTDLGTNTNPATGGGVPNSAKTRVQLGFGGHVGGQITHATLGQGSVLIGEGQSAGLPGLNRDTARFQTVTANRNTGGLNANVTVDHRMLSAQGWQNVGKNFYDTYRHFKDVAVGLKDTLTNDTLGIKDYAHYITDKYKQRQSLAILVHNAAVRAGLNQVDATPRQIQTAMLAYVRATVEGKRLARGAGLYIYNGDPQVIGRDTAGAYFNKNNAGGGYDRQSKAIGINIYKTDPTQTDSKLFIIGHEGYHKLADAKGYHYNQATAEQLANDFGQSASDVWGVYAFLGGYSTDIGGAQYSQKTWLQAYAHSPTVEAGNAWIRGRDSQTLEPAYLMTPVDFAESKRLSVRQPLDRLGLFWVKRYAKANGLRLDESTPGFMEPQSTVLRRLDESLKRAAITNKNARYSAAIGVEQGDTPGSLKQYIARQLGTGFEQHYAKNPRYVQYVDSLVTDAQPGQIINVSPLWAKAKQMTVDRARSNSNLYSNVYDNQGYIYNGSVPLFSSWLGSYGYNFAVKNDALAPPALQHDARNTFYSNLAIDAITFALPIKGLGAVRGAEAAAAARAGETAAWLEKPYPLNFEGVTGPKSIGADVTRAGAMNAQVLAPEIRAAGVVQREASSGNNILNGRMQGGGVVPDKATLTYDISKWSEYGLPSDGKFVRTITREQYLDLKAGREFSFGGKPVEGYPNGMGFIGSAEEVRAINSAAAYKDSLQLGYQPNYVMEFQLRDPTGLQNVLKAPYPEFVPGGRTGAEFLEWNYPGITSNDIINPTVRTLK